MDDAWLASIGIAQHKAWTSIAVKMPTANLSEVTVLNTDLMAQTQQTKDFLLSLVAIPLLKQTEGNRCYWCGSSVLNDIQVAEAGVQTFDKTLSRICRHSFSNIICLSFKISKRSL
ncbi:hypothetical protein [Salicibibacter cibarius]|uniref:hypothetical protein n=1 Tax=Salicibibacter cibarius TaxID=2743000 RepID=UPI003CCD8251